MTVHNRKVEISVSVTIDPKKFTKKFLKDFAATFYKFTTVQQHVDHLAQLYARGVVNSMTTFIEGYGDIKEFGISFKELSIEVDPL